MAIKHISLVLPKTTDPPDINVINTALKEVETKLNATIDQINDALIFVSQTDEYVEVEIPEQEEKYE